MYYAVFDSSSRLSALLTDVNVIPAAAVELSADLRYRMTQENDGVWTLNADGSITKEPLPVADEVGALKERAWRDREIDRVAWLRDRHRDQLEAGLEPTLNEDQFVELLTYIQKLRDWPQSANFPDESARPVPPDWLAGQTQ